MRIYLAWPKSGTTRRLVFVVFLFFFVFHGSDVLRFHLRTIEDLRVTNISCGLIKSYQYGGGIKSRGRSLSLKKEDGGIEAFDFDSWHISSLVTDRLLPIQGALCIEYVYLKYYFHKRFISKIYSNNTVYLDNAVSTKAYLDEKGIWPLWTVFLEFLVTITFLIHIQKR